LEKQLQFLHDPLENARARGHVISKRATLPGARALALLVGIPVAVLLGAQVTGAAPASEAGARTNSATFTDSTGEDAAAPDIRTIVVSNDNAGLITFRINVPNRPALTQDMIFDIWADTDNNPATGSPQFLGADYAIEIYRGAIGLFRWNGTTFSRSPGNPPASSLVYSWQGGATVRITATELGNTKAFKFSVWNTSGVGFDASGNPIFTNARTDIAPDTGTYAYQVVRGPRLKVVDFSPPFYVEAGSMVTASLELRDTVTGKRPSYDSVACRGTASGKAVRTRGYVRRGAAVCEYSLPVEAGGSTLRGSITVRSGGETVRRSFSTRVEKATIEVEIGKATQFPKQPRSGQRFYVAPAVFITVGANGKPERIMSGSVSCKATVGGQAVKTVEQRVLRAAGVRCVWDIPASAEGKVFVGKIRVTVEGTSVTKIFRFTVR
jgi:hypothetical protein